jgi:hypothetical protein
MRNIAKIYKRGFMERRGIASLAVLTSVSMTLSVILVILHTIHYWPATVLCGIFCGAVTYRYGRPHEANVATWKAAALLTINLLILYTAIIIV